MEFNWALSEDEICMVEVAMSNDGTFIVCKINVLFT